MSTLCLPSQRAIRALTVCRTVLSGAVLLLGLLGSPSLASAQTSEESPKSARAPQPAISEKPVVAPTGPAPTGPAGGAPRFPVVPMSTQPTRGRLPTGSQAPLGQLPMGQAPAGQAAAPGNVKDLGPTHDVIPVQMLEQFLFRKDVVNELGLIDEQIDNLTHRIRAAQQEIMLAARPTPGVIPQGPQLQEKMIRIYTQAHRAIESELLPHQRIRMRQLAIQLRYQGGNLRVYTSPEFLANLEYTPDQQAAIAAQQETTEKEIQQTVERLLAEGRARIQRVMTPEQRVKSEEMLGTPFVFVRETQDEFRNRMRRR